MIQKQNEIFLVSRFNMKSSRGYSNKLLYELYNLLYYIKETYNGVKQSVLTIGKIIKVDQTVSIWGTVIDRLSFSFESM